MKLVRRIEKNELLSSCWGIYELSEEQKKKYGKPFILSQGIFSDYALDHMGEDMLIEGLKEHMYEGFFDTEKEAYLTVKIVEMQCKVERYHYALEEIMKVDKIETTNWLTEN